MCVEVLSWVIESDLLICLTTVPFSSLKDIDVYIHNNFLIGVKLFTCFVHVFTLYVVLITLCSFDFFFVSIVYILALTPLLSNSHITHLQANTSKFRHTFQTLKPRTQFTHSFHLCINCIFMHQNIVVWVVAAGHCCRCACCGYYVLFVVIFDCCWYTCECEMNS